jgi:hypothetical protein
MRLTRFKLPALRPVRFLVIAFACVLMMFSYAYPAYSKPLTLDSSSRLDQGEEPLNEIYGESEDSLRTGVLSGEETREKANEGINEVQSSANRENMYTPENSNADTVEDKVKRGLEKLTNRD